jgi:hypothetical protein
MSTKNGGLREGSSNTKAPELASFIDACLEMPSRWL